MFDKLKKVLLNINLVLPTFVISIAIVSCAPIASNDELCSVSLVPNKVIAKRFQESIISIRCEANVDSEQSNQSFGFTNPVFDLSFGGAPRTGLFIIRGNASCDATRVKCWSEYSIAANSIGHLIQHNGNVLYTCQVADQLKNPNVKSLARCESKGYLEFSKTIKYGDSCSIGSGEQECDTNMDCGPPEAENEALNELQCICKNGFTSIPISTRNTICVDEVPLGLVCNYTKQCSAIDSNTICELNENGLKVCQCNQDSYPFSEYQTDFIKICKIKPKTTASPTTEEESTQIISITKSPINTETTTENKSDRIVSSSEPSYGISNKNESTGSVGIILFFVAILLAILIVVIIIRIRNKSDKMVINNKRKTIEQQTDDINEEQSEPILATDGTRGVDEVDSGTDVIESDSNGNDEQIHNKINNLNNTETQKIQTNV